MEVKLTKADLSLIDAALGMYTQNFDGAPTDEGVSIDTRDAATCDVVLVVIVATWVAAHEVNSWLQGGETLHDITKSAVNITPDASLEELIAARNYIAAQLGAPSIERAGG